MNARAVRDTEYTAQKQWLSGYVVGHERKTVWRVEVKIGPNYYRSNRTYSGEASAKAAAKRISGKDAS